MDAETSSVDADDGSAAAAASPMLSCILLALEEICADTAAGLQTPAARW